MSNATFDVVVSGVAPGHHPRKVRQNLVHILKNDLSKVDCLLTGKSVAVLRGTNQSKAVKYITALEHAGLACALRSTARRRPYAAWIKLACAISILFVGFSFYHKARFYLGYSQGRKAVAAEEQGDHESAARLFAAAARSVPESQELSALAALYEGLHFLSNQQMRKALPLLKRYARYDSQDTRVLNLILTVESAIAFEDRNFDRYLALQEKSLAASPQDPMKLAAVASALACKFAVSGNEAARNDCVRYLEQAQKFAGPDRGRFEFYKQRILHRLDSREIISAEEFAHRYPRGYRRES
jgi:tetratricopeptide (TPR) repeat protein